MAFIPLPPRSGVYRALCTTTGRSYVGSAKNMHKRMLRHLYALRKGNHHSVLFQRHFNKYGEHDFIWSVVTEAAPADLIPAEQECLTALFSSGRQLNVRPTANSSLGLVASAETRRKIGDASRGRRHTEATKTRISDSLFRLDRPKVTTRIVSAEARAKMSAAQRRRAPPGPETRAKISAANKGRTASAEARTKMSMAKLGKKLPDSTRAKMSRAHTGSRHKPETRRKIGEALQGERSLKAKLTHGQAKDIRLLYDAAKAANGGRAPNGFISYLSATYGVSKQAIQGLCARRTWRHLCP